MSDILFLVSFSFLMSSTPTVQQHEKFPNVAEKRHVTTCWCLCWSLNFKMSWHTTFPTKPGRAAAWRTRWHPCNERGCPPFEIIERQECKHLLERIGFSLDITQTIQWLWHCGEVVTSQTQNIDILIKTLHTTGREHVNGTKDPGISVPHATHGSLISYSALSFSTTSNMTFTQASIRSTSVFSTTWTFSNQGRTSKTTTCFAKINQVGSCRHRAIPNEHQRVFQVPPRNKQGLLFLHAPPPYCSPSAQESSDWSLSGPRQDNEREMTYHSHWAIQDLP